MFDQERIRVFTGSEAEFVTTHWPVVSLADEANQATEIEAETERGVVEVQNAKPVATKRIDHSEVAKAANGTHTARAITGANNGANRSWRSRRSTY